MTHRAVIYARVSTGRQAEADLSIPDQLRADRAYCAQQGWPVVREYVDAGVSAKSDNRPEFQNMVDDAIKKNLDFDVIVVHSYSRYFRNLFESEFYRRKLLKAGVTIISITQGFGDGPEGDLMRQIIAAFDEYSSNETSKHVLRTMKENAEQGFVNGIAPFGYRSVSVGKRGHRDKKRLDPDPKESPVVEKMFSLVENIPPHGDPLGVRAVAAELERCNYTKRNGRCFSATDVHKILRSPTYMGRHIFNKTSSTEKKKKPESEWVIAQVPAIIEPERWTAVQAILRARNPMTTKARFTGRPTLLSNLARCSACGGAMTLRTGKSGTYRYYVCSNYNRLKARGCSNPRMIREDLLDGLVVDHLADIMFEPARLRAILQDAIKAEQAIRDEAPRELARLERRKSDLDSQISRAHKAIIEGKIADDDDEFAGKLQNLRTERTQLQGIIASLKVSETKYSPLTAQKMREFSAALRAAMRAGDARTRRGYLKFFLASVNVKEREVELCGHKGMLAHAYANDWQAEAVSAGLRRGLPSVLPQVSNGSPAAAQ